MQIAHRVAALAVVTRSAYLGAVAAQELNRIAQENLELATKSHVTMTAHHEAGAASLRDENLARGQALTTDVGVRRTRLDAANAKRQLVRLMSLADNVDDIVLSDSMPEGFDATRQRLYQAADQLNDSEAEVPAMEIRVAVNDLIARLAVSLMTLIKESGYVASNPHQRLIREAMFFQVWSAPQHVQLATIEQLWAS